MGKPEALATVTTALRNLLSDDMGGAAVTTKPPSVARNGESGAQLNIFLYSVRHSPSLRNEPPLGKAKNGELAYPPMPLILKYLITAYGADNDDISGQILLGKAMRILHDHPLLGQADLKDIIPDSGLHEQAERIRITPDTLNLDDMSKLWSSFQSAEYRLSVGYEISVVLIESKRTGKAALPVLKRGEGDMGPEALLDFPPSLFDVQFPYKKMAAELGDIVTLFGKRIPIPATGEEKNRFKIILYNSLVNVRIEPDVADITFFGKEDVLDKIELKLTNQFSGPPGFYMASLQKQKKKADDSFVVEWITNQIAIPIAARILKTNIVSDPEKDEKILSVSCVPNVLKSKAVFLLLGDQIMLPMIRTDSVDPLKLKFDIKNVPSGKYIPRLRVDGVDSIPVDFSSSTPKFDHKQTVIIS